MPDLQRTPQGRAKAGGGDLRLLPHELFHQAPQRAAPGAAPHAPTGREPDGDRRPADAPQTRFRGLRQCPDGSIVFAGHFKDSLLITRALGGLAAADVDVFFGRLDPRGSLQEQGSIAAAIYEPGYERIVGCGPNNQMVLAATFAGSLEAFGLQAQGASDALAAKLDENASPHWTRQFSGEGDEQAKQVAVGPEGEIVVTGSFNGTVVIGEESYDLQGAGGNNPEDACMAKLGP